MRVNKKDYDFAGWVTKNNVKCSDGRTIRQNAFAHMDGKTVPLVYNHNHADIDNVLGNVLLENRKEGVYGYAKTNGTDRGIAAKECVRHGDIVSFSIFANHLNETNSGDVMHGDIKEVSLVLSGANEEALIDTFFEHGVEGESGMYFYMAESGAKGNASDFELCHADKDDDEDKEEKEEAPEEETSDAEEESEEEPEEADKEEEDKKLKHADSEKTVEDIVNTMNDEQKDAMYALIGAALQEAKNKKSEDSDEDEKEDTVEHSDEGGEEMKVNAFENEQAKEKVLEHSDIVAILDNAKSNGSLKQAFNSYCLAHSIDTTGMNILPAQSTASQDYGVRDLDMLFPEYKSLNNPPEWIKRDTTWADVVMAGVHKVPFKRIKSMFANITEDEARAKGYIKGDQKAAEVFELLGRTTDPQTIYKMQQLDRDDILDIEDFDVVAWIKGEMRIMLNEEKARAILIGDGRSATNKYKIKEDHVRPIAFDVPLFTIKAKVDAAADATDEEIYTAFIEQVLLARIGYKGSGNPTLFTTEETLTKLLLLKDKIGHPLYKTEAELATALRVTRIVTVEVMEGLTGDYSSTVTAKPVMGVIVNLNDYTIGGDTNKEQGMFEDFDIDFNQYKYLIETRMSGALTKPYSAITVFLNKAAATTQG